MTILGGVEPWGVVLQRPRTDIFADYWLESRKNAPVAVRRVYREFERHVDNSDQLLEPMIQALIQDARYFERFEEVDSSNRSREAQFHSRRLDLALGAIWPLLLQLQRIDAEQAERDRWFAALESYFVRRMIVGYQARSYDQVALELLNVLPTANDRGVSIADAILEHLLRYSEAASLWPSDVEVKQAVSNRHLPQYAQRLVLSAIEQRLITNGQVWLIWCQMFRLNTLCPEDGNMSPGRCLILLNEPWPWIGVSR